MVRSTLARDFECGLQPGSRLEYVNPNGAIASFTAKVKPKQRCKNTDQLVRESRFRGLFDEYIRLKEVVGASFRSLTACFVRKSVVMWDSDVSCANVFDFHFERLRSEHPSNHGTESFFWQRAH